MKLRLILAVLALCFAALACNVPSAIRRTTGTPDSVGQMLTQVAQTVAAELALTPSAPAGGIVPTLTPGGPPTAYPTLALIPTAGGQAANTTAAGDSTAAPCDYAAFVQDVTIPDGTRLAPGQSFTKTWRLRNLGSCTWTTGYAVVFVQGDALGAPAAVALAGPVPPGATVDLPVDMKAPAASGSYTGYWRLRNAAGMQFGTGANQPFYVEIVVGGTLTPIATPAGGSTNTTPVGSSTATQAAGLSLAADYCQALWRSQTGTLTCPGIQGASAGTVARLTNPQIETGQAETRAVLLTAPNRAADGAITGSYPVMTVEAGMRFRATLGCLNGANDCAVVYQLNYVAGSSSAASLGQWAHTYTGATQDIDVDLSPLAGRQVSLILAVLANGPAEGDQAVWIDPRIVK